LNNFFSELHRRNIFRVAGVYAVVAWLLMQLAAVLENSLNLPDWFDTAITATLLLGFPIAMILTWAFELTPEGVKRTETVQDGESITDRTGRKLDIAILIGLVVVGALGVSNLFAPATGPQNTPSQIAAQDGSTSSPTRTSIDAPVSRTAVSQSKSIAVLPFTNQSPDPDNAFFADGVHDELLTQLSKITDMHVISRTSVMGYKGTVRKIPEIARELGVATVMEGSVQRAGKRVRINVQLIDAETDAHLWAEIYDKELTADNIFEIQTEITKAIAAALEAVLTDEDIAALDTKPTSNLEAYDAYLRGQAIFNGTKRDKENILVAIAEYDKAIVADQGFIAAYSAKSQAQLFMYWAVDRGNEDWVKAARDSIDAANNLAPDNVETLIAEGYYYYWGFLDYRRADSYIDRALRKAPNNAGVWSLKGYVARRDGRFVDAIAALENGIKLDPLSMLETKELFFTYVKFGQLKKAENLLTQFKRNFPDNESLLWFEAELAKARGDFDLAWNMMKNPPDEAGIEYYFTRAMFAIRTRDKENIDLVFEDWPETMKIVPGYPETFAMIRAFGHAAAGELDTYRELASGISNRIETMDNPYPRGWGSNSSYWPGIIEAMNQDKDGVYAAEQDYLSNASTDAYIDLDRMVYFSTLFAIVGETDKAFDYLEKNIKAVGSPVSFSELQVDPSFDNLRTHPRYLAIKSDYDKWRRESAN